jgi:hypothetical protein
MQTSGEWREERLYVLQTIEDMKADLRRQSEVAAVTRASITDIAQRDINVAHDKIRALEGIRSRLRIKNWIMTAALSASVAMLFEFIKAYLRK